jgi:CYTH domain-containing protein
MKELEKTYLAKAFPTGLKNCKSKEIIDIYIPKSSIHPKIRIRKYGDKYEITKKEPVNYNDASHQDEQTITLNESEFNELAKLEGKKTHKIRYYYDHNGKMAEIDVFQGALKGLVLVDFEFKTSEEKASFKMPNFCLADVTQEGFIAGGVLCGKRYEDVEKDLKRFNYSKLFLE